MKYFTFRDRDSFYYPKEEIWNTVLNVQKWPHTWKHVVDIQIEGEEKVTLSSKIHCHLTLMHLINLHFDVHVNKLEENRYASFSFTGDFSGQGRWILKTENSLSSSLLNLHLQPHHPLLRLISFLPFGRELLLYTHKRVMLEGKKMIIKRLSHE